MGSVIKVNDVSMMFNLSSEKIDSIKEYFIKAVRRELHFQEFWALRDISFTLEKGDSLGIDQGHGGDLREHCSPHRARRGL